MVKLIRGIMRLIKTLIVVGGTFVVIGGIGYWYAGHIEPRLLTSETYTVHSSKVTKDLEDIRIAQFSDTQLGPFYSQEDLKKVVRKINEMKPDIIVFTGDLLDNYSTYEEDPEGISILLDEMQAPLGKYAIYGNHDVGGGAVRVYEKIMEAGGFKVLKNKIMPLELADGNILNIIGLDDWMLGAPELTNTLQKLNNKEFNVLLLHEPDIADRVTKYPVDLQLSGHSHGGQVRLPLIGHIVVPPYGEKYTKGSYNLKGQYPLQLYVNSGLGNTKLPFRFLNVPTITEINFDYHEK